MSKPFLVGLIIATLQHLKYTVTRTVTTIFILKGGLEVTIGGGLTMVEAEELRKFYDFQTSKHAITGHTLG